MGDAPWSLKTPILNAAFWRTNESCKSFISHMAESEPKFLDRLKAIFTRHHTLGADEQDFTGTEQYAEQFIRQIEILVERKKH